ncbi:MAG: aldo/keto reductase [Candidatus Aenigmarchaeota archaeon]|nr:aldo/keto reductase [Candidatus Aenigmarchaeota archaeon]
MDLRSAARLRDGITMPWLGLGTYQAPPGPATRAAVRAALAAGYRHIDTAAYYRNEQDVGKALRESGIPREDVFLTTKIHNDHHDDPAKAVETSRRLLGVDCIDLFLIHWPVPERLATWKILERLQREGKIRSIGVSNFTIRHLQQLLAAGGQAPAVNQVELSPFLAQEDLRAFCRKQGIQVEAYSPLTKGRKFSDPRLAALASRLGKTPAQVLVRWALENRLVAIPKSVREDRIRENAAVFDFSLREQDLREMRAWDEGFRTSWDPTDIP